MDKDGPDAHSSEGVSALLAEAYVVAVLPDGRLFHIFGMKIRPGFGAVAVTEEDVINRVRNWTGPSRWSEAAMKRFLAKDSPRKS